MGTSCCELTSNRYVCSVIIDVHMKTTTNLITQPGRSLMFPRLRAAACAQSFHALHFCSETHRSLVYVSTENHHAYVDVNGRHTHILSLLCPVCVGQPSDPNANNCNTAGHGRNMSLCPLVQSLRCLSSLHVHVPQVLKCAYKLPGPSHRNYFEVGCQSAAGCQTPNLPALASHMDTLGLPALKDQFEHATESAFTIAATAAAAAAHLISAFHVVATDWPSQSSCSPHVLDDMQASVAAQFASSSSSSRYLAAVDSASAAAVAATTAATSAAATAAAGILASASAAAACGAVVATGLSNALHCACLEVRQQFQLGLVTVALRLGEVEGRDTVSMVIGTSAASWEEVVAAGDLLRQHVEMLLM